MSRCCTGEKFAYVCQVNEQQHAMNAPKNITNAKGTKLTLVEQMTGISDIGCTMQAGYVSGKGVEYLVQFFGDKLARIISTGSGKVEIVIL